MPIQRIFQIYKYLIYLSSNCIGYHYLIRFRVGMDHEMFFVSVQIV